jgi:hypothetical protein
VTLLDPQLYAISFQGILQAALQFNPQTNDKISLKSTPPLSNSTNVRTTAAQHGCRKE